MPFVEKENRSWKGVRNLHKSMTSWSLRQLIIMPWEYRPNTATIYQRNIHWRNNPDCLHWQLVLREHVKKVSCKSKEFHSQVCEKNLNQILYYFFLLLVNFWNVGSYIFWIFILFSSKLKYNFVMLYYDFVCSLVTNWLRLVIGTITESLSKISQNDFDISPYFLRIENRSIQKHFFVLHPLLPWTLTLFYHGLFRIFFMIFIRHTETLIMLNYMQR